MLLQTILFVFISCSLCFVTPEDDHLFNLTVIHINDFHARYEETSDSGGICKDDKCIGGISRLYRTIKDNLEARPDALLLNAGDNFQGTPWYNFFKWNVTQYFLNQLPFDAITLGNHEFDDEVDGVVPYLKSLKAPVVVSNIDDSMEPDFQHLYKKSVVVERNGKKIGIIGVITKTTGEISRTGKLRFLDESESVNAEAERLVKEEDVFTNIVLSHSGYDVEKQMAKNTTADSKISLIVGGHSHSFLYTGVPVPGPETPVGPYPTIVENADGNEVLVVQASSFSRYLGDITVSYDQEGNYVDWDGKPIFLGHDVPQDDTINAELQPWKDSIDDLSNAVVGSTLVSMDERICRVSECLLGNFVTDAMVFAYIGLAGNTSWTYASLAVYNTGSLRSPLEAGDITYGELLSAQPFGNTIDVAEIEGRYIKEMFEVSVSPKVLGRARSDVNLLHVSGFKIVANLSRPIGSRIESVKVRCNECLVPVYEDLDLDKTYRLILTPFLETGGDGFHVIQDNIKNLKIGRVDLDVLVDYLKARSPVYEEIEGRIVIVGDARLDHENV